MFRMCMPSSSHHRHDAEEGDETMGERQYMYVRPTIPILVEIVGATNLSCATKRCNNITDKRVSKYYNNRTKLPDSYCIVKQPSQGSTQSTLPVRDHHHQQQPSSKFEIIHKTDAISQNEDPIWTIKTKSLCIIEIPDYSNNENDDKNNKNNNNNNNNSNNSIKEEEKKEEEKKEEEHMNQQKYHYIIVQVMNGKKMLGNVKLSYQHLLQGNGEREEYPLLVPLIRPPDAETVEGNNVLLMTSDVENENEDEVDNDNNNNNSNKITATTTTTTTQAMLALRFRLANEDDIIFLKEQQLLSKNKLSQLVLTKAISTTRALRSSLSSINNNNNNNNNKQRDMIRYDEEAMDKNFQHVIKSPIFSFNQKKDTKTGDILYRIYPPKKIYESDEPIILSNNSNNQKQPQQQQSQQQSSSSSPPSSSVIEWMTKEQIEKEVYGPSWDWTETGHGEAGTLFLEIIGCDNLPIMDIDGSTDPFVAIVFEDTMVRTKVLFNTLSPRWMPWSARAFAFNITHPGSVLFLSVVDYDEEMMLVKEHNDPIGRVVISTMNFECGMTYTLHYNLVDSSQPDTPRGTITIRLRIEWEDENKAAKLALLPPPPFIINVENEKAWHVLHYCTYGAINMDIASLASVKLYLSEVKDYWGKYCYFLDVLVGILLWRGRAKVNFFGRSINIWFPVQSIWLFTSVLTAFEKPSLAISVLCYGLAWIMISCNYHNSRHPYAWYRVKTFESLIWGIVRGPTAHLSTIEPNTGVTEKSHLDTLAKLKSERMSAFMSAFLKTASRAYSIYSGTNFANALITTEDTSTSFFTGKLHYPHMALKYFCNYCRTFRNFICWKSYGSFNKTLNLLILGSLCLVPQFRLASSWLIRIWIFVFLGPIMKIVDVIWIHEYFKTNEELLDDIINDRQDENYWFLPFFDSIIDHDIFHSMKKTGRIVAEDATKLGVMREKFEGTFSEKVPWIDNSRNFSYALPQSSAKPYTADDKLPPRKLRWKFAPSSKLEGNMIMKRAGPPPGSLSLKNLNDAPLESKKER